MNHVTKAREFTAQFSGYEYSSPKCPSIISNNWLEFLASDNQGNFRDKDYQESVMKRVFFEAVDYPERSPEEHTDLPRPDTRSHYVSFAEYVAMGRPMRIKVKEKFIYSPTEE